MSNVKKLFSSPKKAAATLICAGVIVVALGVGIVVNAAGRPSQTSAIGGVSAQSYAFADAGVDPVDARALKVKYERFQGTFVYEVEFTAGDTEYEYKINEEDGSVVKKESKTVKTAGTSQAPVLTLEEARDAALADAGVNREEAVFTKEKPDREDGVSVYEFEFRVENVEYEYEINAATGAVFSKSMVIHEQGGGTPGAAQAPAPAQSAPPAQTTQPPVQTAQPTQPPASSTPPSTPAPAQTQQPSSQAYIGVDAAKTAALADAGVDASQASFTKAHMDYEDGVPVYEIEFCTSTHEYEYEIHATTGSVCHRSAELCHSSGGHHSGGHHDDPHHSAPSPSDAAYIGVDAAKAAALTHAGRSSSDVTFTKAKLDYDDGRAVYDIEFRQGRAEYEYEIDAISGAVLEYEWDQD